MTQPIVLVLAGGVSSRFWPLRDKLLLPFGSQTLIERHLHALEALGCDRMVIVTRADLVDTMHEAGDGVDADVRIAVQSEPRGMADAVLSARDAIASLGGGPVYVTQAHDVVESRMHADVLERWARRPEGVAGIIAASRRQDYFPGGYLTTDGDRVASIVEKPGAGNQPSDLVNIVAHVHGSFDALSAATESAWAVAPSDDAYERALDALIRDAVYEAHIYEGSWQGLKYPWHVLDVMDLMLDLWVRGVESPGEMYEQLDPGVFTAPDVRVFPGGHIAAPALLGAGCIVGNNALVRASIIGPKSVVGFGSEVARSYLAGEVELHHNYVGDSVLDRDTSMGWGATTANYRIDHRTVPSVIAGQRMDTGRQKLGLVTGSSARIGVNASLMPGVKVGAGALIGPAIRITRDVPDGERVLDEETYGYF